LDNVLHRFIPETFGDLASPGVTEEKSRLTGRELITTVVAAVGWKQGRFYVGAGGTCPQIYLLPQIQKLADRSDVISGDPKCSKIQIFQGSVPDPAGGAYSAPQTP